MNDSDIHDTIRGLYEGIVDPQAWQRSLQNLRRASGSAQMGMVVLDKRNDRMSVTELANPVEGLAQAYQQTFQALDPGRSFAPRLPLGSWYIDARELGVDAIARHPFYRDFLQRYGMRSVMACLVDRQPYYEVYFSLQRPLDGPLFAPEDARALDWAIPHIRQAMALRERTSALTALQRLSMQLLDQLAFGVIVFSADARVLLHNSEGEAWVRRLLPNPAAPRTATATGAGDEWTLSRPFAAMVRAACDASAPVAAQAATAQSRRGARAQVIVLPLPPSHAMGQAWQQPAALVAIHDTRSGSPLLLPQVLRDLYGLTPAETRLATLLTTGIGLPEACEQLQIGRETSRTQLKAVFIKTGTNSQAQLSHLLTQLSATLKAPSAAPHGDDA
ncbi:helix-turn-helix transcriptional regulator [Cupriavidus gilardii]|uniref:helix-turn-helix transcriptional regulator n=1 Tax=Cupriavidus gilardii TaxID=82541 RepID=UPI001572DF42|nr:helix-turn-helix transcriptional regulator [Cupriavidus gilardii]NSX02205.1 helix-turn-helix transcriptional regulator [Cupriavidus gilardii]